MPEWLTRKIGPLPAWGWGLVGVGVFVIYRLRQQSAASQSATPASASYTATVPTGGGSSGEPSASYTTPGGFTYQGPLSGLEQLVGSGAFAATPGSSAPTPVATTPAPSTSPTPSLPPVNAASFPQIVKFGQYSPGQYTQIGTVTGGQYSGYNVTGGVPVYANVLGGFAQGFNESTLPSGTGLYIPSQFTGYETTHT